MGCCIPDSQVLQQPQIQLYRSIFIINEFKIKMAPAPGFEPGTKWLTATYSTAELCRSMNKSFSMLLNIYLFLQKANRYIQNFHKLSHFFTYYIIWRSWSLFQDVCMILAILIFYYSGNLFPPATTHLVKTALKCFKKPFFTEKSKNSFFCCFLCFFELFRTYSSNK